MSMKNSNSPKTERKSFRIDKTTENLIKELEEYYRTKNNSEIIRNSLIDAKAIKDKLYLKTSECEEQQSKLKAQLEEKEKETKTLYIEIGKLQNELNKNKQKNLPKQKESLISKIKNLFGIN